ncbi:uncharacterized protein LOC112088490 [Eutrema salsugineum]|uniref:uncharacterized protein LOC112088490 n=1 Tax=Eutrema salsugineum TaxID=72664 RepID=UPI000CED1367|nr:uncharacterized protein LOC112088490 [Eutrema salsugineum]
MCVDPDWPRPENASEIRSFLGLAGYYRRFVKGFASMAQPMTRLTGKDVPFVWSAECEKSFANLKEMLTSTPVLALPEPDQPYVVYTDHPGKANLVTDALSRKRIAALAEQDVEGLVRMVGTLRLAALTDEVKPLGLGAADQADLLSRVRIA